MDRYNISKLLHTFVMAFFVLFMILVILPMVVDQFMHLFSEIIIPRSDSIIVFKDFDGEKEAIIRFLKVIIKIINFM